MSTATTLRLDLNGGDEPVTLEEEVRSLEPGALTTVSFPDLAVVPGGAYEVIATLVGVEADVDPTDNEIAVEFTVNEGEGSG
jgi:hypothetical protein